MQFKKFLVVIGVVVLIQLGAGYGQAAVDCPEDTSKPQKCSICFAKGGVGKIHTLERGIFNFNKPDYQECGEELYGIEKPLNIKPDGPLSFTNKNDSDSDKDKINFTLRGSDKTENRLVIDLSGLPLGPNGNTITYGLSIYNRNATFTHFTLKVKDKDAAPYAIYNDVRYDTSLGDNPEEFYNLFQNIRIVDADDEEIATVDPNTGEITVKEEVIPTPTPPPTLPPFEDTDGDDVQDLADNCPNDSNKDQDDFDEDGMGDVCDDDNDADGVIDTDDNCPPIMGGDGKFEGQWMDTENTNQANQDSLEEGDNLVGDMCDPDDDGDGIDDLVDNCPYANPDQLDEDGDGFGKSCDPDGDLPPGSDADGDGINHDEALEICASGEKENCSDNCPNDSNPDQLDTDGDHALQGGDACDSDDDNDGINDSDEDKNGNGQVDVGETDPKEVDTDGDDWIDSVDTCPLDSNPSGADGLQADSDGDGIGDVCDVDTPESDTDHDGVANDQDNCVGDANPGQEDADGDQVGDACDPDDALADSDLDGVANDLDNCPQAANADQADTDQDGVGDACESAVSQEDADEDGVVDTSDNCVSVKNPGQEDADSDQIGDACDPDNPQGDSDNDGVPNETDNCKFIGNSDQADSDGDKIGDACDQNMVVEPTPQPESGGGCTLAPLQAYSTLSWMFYLIPLLGALVLRKKVARS
ncbi:MAG: thrombospondin type 3 repeat-containing protein [Deltaproteobacteria bacterium]|nr:thrombospondin type 3 repeat-containing protein [Deltaproteobacteria bacterium]